MQPEGRARMVARSYLYVPGDRREKLARARERGADGLVLDLEDAVAPPAKDSAREVVAAFLTGLTDEGAAAAPPDASAPDGPAPGAPPPAAPHEFGPSGSTRSGSTPHGSALGTSPSATSNGPTPAGPTPNGAATTVSTASAPNGTIFGGPELWVRVNADRLDEDVPAVTLPSCAGVWVPKADPESLARVDALLTAAERAAGLPAGVMRVVPVIETARGLLAVAEIARAPRVLRLGIGEADLAAELGIRPGRDRAELAPHRAALVVASAAAGLAAPIAPVETDLSATGADLAATTRALLCEGFRARTAIHPRQVPVINEVFTPSPAEIAAARDVVTRLGAANQSGTGVAVDARGRMIDEAVARSAREVLGRAPAS
uniref:HpcH/HpaI aldolase/citrate lyase family protein n=1 Tax=Microbispora cellulosiformans TaxID=2614688 RepID=UPI00177D0483|nr:aldolase/citrate lyase family protein [Microbispora cellulosiformans]